jgi:hypothetical protein
MNTEPLIYTSKGNLPITHLGYATTWEEDDQMIALVETYTLDGEIVRQSKHIKVKQGLTLFPEAEKI